MRTASFKQRMLNGEFLAGTFLKTPAYEMIEILANSGLDFICLDAEHSPFDRARMDACLAMARALDFPVLVRVGAFTPQDVLQALDSGAVGIVAPHVDSVEKAQDLARSGRFGDGGRGFAGSSRWAGFGTRTMADVLAQSRDETVMIAQIEEPEAVDIVDQIAAVDGIDALFVGPGDLSVAYGHDNWDSDELAQALEKVGKATKANGKAFITFTGDIKRAQDWSRHGVTTFFVASEHNWIIAGAKSTAAGIHGLKT